MKYILTKLDDGKLCVWLFPYILFIYYYYLLMPSKLMNERGGTCDLVTRKLCVSWWKQMQQNQ